MGKEKKKLFVEWVEITKDIRGFSRGFSLDFTAPLTILVGENGTGKSTLLDLIRSHYTSSGLWQDDLKEYARVTGLQSPSVKYFNFHSDDFKYSTLFGPNMDAQLAAMRRSSGEGVTLQLVACGILAANNSLLLLDEVARGYSPAFQARCAQGIYSLVSKGNQLIVASHSEYVMELGYMPDCKLYSVEHRRYMTPKEFLTAHLTRKKKVSELPCRSSRKSIKQ
ncbi:AAA family ATPase [Candidatus Woesearchaeota archaeon]|nr:AAA family ATPase [Candidatus Woesearchaeota archaeon]